MEKNCEVFNITGRLDKKSFINKANQKEERVILVKSFREIGVMNCILIATIIFLWISVFFINGLIGAYAWALLKMILPILGICGVFINIFLFIFCLVKRKKYNKLLVNFILNLVLIFPILMTMNIIQFIYPIDIERVEPSITIKWPFAEETIVVWGGDSIQDNLIHVTWPSERWAYDLVMEPYDIGSKNNEEYGIWDKKVYSPISGVVIAAYDGEKDIDPGSEDFTLLEGNHVYIKVDETGTYLLLNHLKEDSVTVKEGDRVNPGDVIGRIGNSGSTSEPHLHIHHQRQDPTKVLHPILAEGLPLYFEGINGEAMPKKGDIILPDTLIN
ncbi:M23 family metallopeptidase [Metabacillus litoralis]|uniref:M23 family metallopeptidase n=1 Tax=Metabacillus litoralis TaxID=152268 RepID=UPI00204031A8|nr:M23 family metallopeptidase [Metabacillus litoralis]MCM3163558.1 M23 family metallopeptidase [Metabacillus litoralis]